MKKLLLTVLAAAATFGAMAAVPTLTASGNKTIDSQLDDVVAGINPVAVAKDGSIIATGLFNGNITIDGNNLESVGTGTFVVKYTSDFNGIAWAVGLDGSVTVKAIDVDKDGNIYIAGTLADEVIFGSTDGVTKEAAGYMENEEYSADQKASFVARYSAAGVVTGVVTFVPSPLDNDAVNNPEAYYDTNVLFNINHLKVDGNKVYLSAIYSGSTEKDGVKFEGSYQDPWGGFYLLDLPMASVFSLNASDLTGCVKVSNCAISAPVEGETLEKVLDVDFAVADSKLYVTYLATGNHVVTVGSKTETVTCNPEGDSEENVYGFIYISEDGVSVLKTLDNTSSQFGLNAKSMFVDKGTVYGIGTFNKFLPIASIPAETQNISSNSDIFVATLNAADMSVKSVIPFTNDEGKTTITNSDDTTEDKPNSEVATGGFYYGSSIYINTNIYDYNQSLLKPASYWFDGSDFSIAPCAAKGGAVNADGIVALANSTKEALTINRYTATVGLEEVIDNAQNDVRVYPNPVVDVLNFSQPVDVTVYTINGAIVKSAAQVSSLDVTDLATGLYLVKAGKKAVRIVKK